MKKIEMAKAIVEGVVSVGVCAIVANAIRTTTPTDVRFITKVCIAVGGIVLGSMATDAATDYTEKKIDEAVGQIKEMAIKADTLD